MSIQPLTNASAPTDAGPRRRAAEREPNERESFVLPQEEPVREAPAAPRERREASAEDDAPVRDGRDPARTTDERKATSDEVNAAKTEETGEATTAGEARADKPAKPAKAGQDEPQKPAVVSAPAPKPAAAVRPDLDVAALVTIAQAAQGETPAQAPVIVAAAAAEASGAPASQAGQTDGTTAGTDEAAKPAEDGKGEGAILVTLPDLVTAETVPAVPVQPMAVPVPAAPAAMSAPSASAPPRDGDGLTGKGGAAATTQAAAAIAARMPATVAGDPQQPVADQASGSEVAGAPAPRPATDSFTAVLALTPETAAPAPKAEAVSTGLPATAEVAVKTEPAAAPSTAATAEFKPLERLDQALGGIDLSAMTAQGAARPDPLRLLATPDTMHAQTPAQPSHAAAESPPTPLHVLPIEIGLKALSGARQFDIRLDPGELGRVDVTLSISDTGEVSARMVVDRVETLHLLQRDARTLERAFEQAGLKPSDAGVDISLRDPSDQSGFRQQRQQDDTPQRRRGSASGAEAGDDIAITPLSAPQRRFVRLGGVDVSV
jgi:flagellar hook-length control protein FliK